ncbi:sugar phosphate nucleotidyltransferase [Streptomyces griseus]|uniref:sugar phosphate nucleotidyltransferase n=1 Tax=Streptomyces griseus TaxID=1911 RepID=UPI00378777DF
MGSTRAVLLAGGEGRRMGRLGAGRLKPLVPFGGTGRLIDFSLVNAKDSGFSEVLLLSQHEERQLMDDLDAVWNGAEGFRVHFGPHDGAYRDAPSRDRAAPPEAAAGRERGTADALIKKAPYIFGEDVSRILVLHADHVYRYDYRAMLREHEETGAALTVSYQRIDRRYVPLFGQVEFDATNQLTSFVEKPAEPTSDLVFAAFCVFDAAILRRYLETLSGTDWQYDISRDVIPAMLAGGERIIGHQVRGYWEDIGTVERYHRAHMALVGPRPPLTREEIPHTIGVGLGSRLVAEDGPVCRSLVPSDLVCAGRLTDSVAFPGVRIGEGASVSRSVLLPGARVPSGGVVDSAIVLEDGTVQQVDVSPEPSREAPDGS